MDFFLLEEWKVKCFIASDGRNEKEEQEHEEEDEAGWAGWAWEKAGLAWLGWFWVGKGWLGKRLAGPVLGVVWGSTTGGM